MAPTVNSATKDGEASKAANGVTVAVLELVGVRDLAEEDPSEYQRCTNAFLNGVREALMGLDDSHKGRESVKLLFFRDVCYLEGRISTTIVGILQILRTALLSKSQLLVRGFLLLSRQGLGFSPDLFPQNQAEDFINLLEKKGFRRSVLQGFQLGQVEADLFGKLEAFKGIGIQVAPNLLELGSVPRSMVLRNCFVCDSRVQPYRQYYDLRLPREMLSPANMEMLFDELAKTTYTSRKVGRFFVPFLVNWAQSMDLEGEPEEGQLDDLLSRGSLSRFSSRIKGFELVYFSIIDRLYGDKDITLVERYNARRVTLLKNHLLDRAFVRKKLSNEDLLAATPEDVIRKLSRRRYAEESSKHLATKRKGSKESGEDAPQGN